MNILQFQQTYIEWSKLVMHRTSSSIRSCISAKHSLEPLATGRMLSRRHFFADLISLIKEETISKALKHTFRSSETMLAKASESHHTTGYIRPCADISCRIETCIVPVSMIHAQGVLIWKSCWTGLSLLAMLA